MGFWVSGRSPIIVNPRSCCGANIGEVTGYLAPSGAEIHAFEPDPYAFSRLKENCGQFENVTFFNQTVGVGASTLNIYRAASFGKNPEWNSLMTTSVMDPKVAEARKMEKIEVECIDLESHLSALIAQGKNIALLKMDIEGAELDVLERLVQTDILTHIKSTVVEIHPWMFKRQPRDFQKLKAIAKKRKDFNLNLDWY